jgi:hypothetical protein
VRELSLIELVIADDVGMAELGAGASRIS